MPTPHSAHPRHGQHEAQPAKPLKPLEYIRQSQSVSDLSNVSSHSRRGHGSSSNNESGGWYTAPVHPPPSQPPPPRPPKLGGSTKVAGSTRSSESSIADVQKPYAQKVRGSGGPEGNEFVAELEGDFIGLGLSNVKAPVDNKKARDAARKKGKGSPDTEAMARAIVQESRVPPRKRKLRVLSLDGGGIRGYSSLVILSDLMHRIHMIINKNVPVAPHQLPRPCDFFDIIGGNGTGGLIALMLGRMRMDVETCKEYYEALTRYVFVTDKTILGMPYGNTLFKASRLEEAIKVCVRECTRYDHLPLLHYVPLNRRNSLAESITPPQVQPASTIRIRGSRKGSWPRDRKGSTQITPSNGGTTSTFSSFSSNSTSGARDDSRYSQDGIEYSSFSAVMGNKIDNTLGNPDTPLYDHRVGACKTFLTTSYISSTPGSPPVLLRSYQTARDPGTVSGKATIWQAGRATSATRSAFKPITIANVQFLDEGYGKYNPAMSVLDEALAKETWHDVEDVVVDGQDPEIGVFVSIGTGKRFTSQRDDGYDKPGGVRKDKPLWWENMGMLEQYSEAKKRLLAKLEDCETVHLSLLHGELDRRGVDRTNYFRFNVEVGVGEFGLNEWNRLPEVSTGTRRYLARPEVENGLVICADKLVDIWHTNELRDKWKMGVPSPPEEASAVEGFTLQDGGDEDAQRRKEREKRRAARKAKGGAKTTSPPMSPSGIAELEADIDQAATEWSSSHTGSHSGSDGEYHPSPQTNTYQSTPPQQQAYHPPPSHPNPQEYFSPPLPPAPQRPPQGYRPQQVSQWVQHLPPQQKQQQQQQQQYQRPIRIPTPADFMPPKIITSAPPPEDGVPEDYFGVGPNPEIRVTSPTTVAGDETPPGTPQPLRRERSIEGDRQARRERRERKTRKEREERERMVARNLV